MSGVSTMPDKVTTPSLVSTWIGNDLSAASALIDCVTFAVIAASSRAAATSVAPVSADLPAAAVSADLSAVAMFVDLSAAAVPAGLSVAMEADLSAIASADLSTGLA